MDQGNVGKCQEEVKDVSKVPKKLYEQLAFKD
jgi:hypothetical protein